MSRRSAMAVAGWSARVSSRCCGSPCAGWYTDRPCLGPGVQARRGRTSGTETCGDSGTLPGRVDGGSQSPDDPNGVKNRPSIKESVDRGMRELTGADDATSAWRRFFEPGDVVGIKMNPVGIRWPTRQAS